MDAAIAGLIGAGIGALVGLTSSLVGHVVNAHLQHRAWLRDRRNEAYAATLRYLGRVTRKRSKILGEAGPILGEDAVKEWFDDINEAQTWLSTLSIYCSDEYRKPLMKANAVLDETINTVLNHGMAIIKGKRNTIDEIAKIHDSVLDIARKDMRRVIGRKFFREALERQGVVLDEESSVS
jgi:hypothetical protein